MINQANKGVVNGYKYCLPVEFELCDVVLGLDPTEVNKLRVEPIRSLLRDQMART